MPCGDQELRPHIQNFLRLRFHGPCLCALHHLGDPGDRRAAYQEGALTDLPDLSLYQEPEESTQTDQPEDPENPKDHE